MASTAPARFDVAAFIDERPIGWREITTLAVVSIVHFIDGFDMYYFGKMLPAIAEGLGVSPQGMPGVVTAQQVGMFAGAIVMPPLADRIGRKPVLGLCLLVFGVLSLWAAYATTPAMMAWLRGVSGIFFSAMLPVALALLSEMTPRRRRASFMSIALVCFSGANIASGAMTAWLLDIYGWQIGFWLGGLLPLAALPLLLLIPESLPFRVTRDARDARIGAAFRVVGFPRPVRRGEMQADEERPAVGLAPLERGDGAVGHQVGHVPGLLDGGLAVPQVGAAAEAMAEIVHAAAVKPPLSGPKSGSEPMCHLPTSVVR